MHSFLKNNVFSISFGTSLSKLAGCVRQIFIAAAFGVGVTYDAYNYAYIIPGFLLRGVRTATTALCKGPFIPPMINSKKPGII